jgi:hypothetical protein
MERIEKEITGRVSLSLHTPRGELRGALLENGSVLRVGPREATSFAALLRPGAMIAARGEGLETSHGIVVDVREIGPSANELRPTTPKKPEDFVRDDRSVGFGGSLP